MRKVLLSMEAQEKYVIIKKLAEGHISKQTAAVKIGCTPRHVNRLLNQYHSDGKTSFLHGNTGRKPVHAFSSQQITDITALYNSKYFDSNFTHCCELLLKHDSIQISPFSLRRILNKEFILSPRATRRSKKRMNQTLRDLHKIAKTQLHVAVDDCTGMIMGAYFDHQETLKGYYNVL